MRVERAEVDVEMLASGFVDVRCAYAARYARRCASSGQKANFTVREDARRRSVGVIHCCLVALPVALSWSTSDDIESWSCRRNVSFVEQTINVDGVACVFSMYCMKFGRLIPSRTSGVAESMVEVDTDFHGGGVEQLNRTSLYILILFGRRLGSLIFI